MYLNKAKIQTSFTVMIDLEYSHCVYNHVKGRIRELMLGGALILFYIRCSAALNNSRKVVIA